MYKKMTNFFVFIGLLLLYTVFSSCVLYLLDYSGFNVSKIGIHSKNALLIAIDVIVMIITYLFYLKDCNHDLKKYLKNFFKYFGYGIGLWIIGILLMIISNLLIMHFVPSAKALNEDAVQEMLRKTPVYASFAACIFAPFMEEMIFRKSLRKVFEIDVLYILVSGFLFGLVHNLSSLGTESVIYIIPYGLFGCVFAYAYVKKKNIFIPIVMHMIHNTVLVIISLIQAGVLFK